MGIKKQYFFVNIVLFNVLACKKMNLNCNLKIKEYDLFPVENSNQM